MATFLAISPEFYLGSHVSNFCPNGYHDDKENHCAHFVSHVLGFNFGYTCIMQTGKGAGGASIRVQELFARCPEVGMWEDKPPLLLSCLAFVTDMKNVDLGSQTMKNVRKKHVGIFYKGRIYHYSNSRDKVSGQSADQFKRHYPGVGIRVYFGTFPSKI